MNLVELAVIIVGAGLGYWLVSFMFKGKGAARPSASSQTPAYGAPASTWPTVLGVGDNAGVDEIRAAYKRLMSQYHPDKVASLGSELQELAERKTKEIAAAYREALAARGASE